MIEGPKRPRDREREREDEKTSDEQTKRRADKTTRGRATSRRDELVACRAGGLQGDPHVAIAPRDERFIHSVIARRTMPDAATLRLSREQNQACLNYAVAEQGRPKVNLILLT